MMIQQNELFAKYRIDTARFTATGLVWNDLVAIAEDFEAQRPSLEQTADLIANQLRRVGAVHAIKARVKDPEHLIEKIIRKRVDKPDRVIDLSNYQSEITDLIGVRVLHLFKNEWPTIDTFIRDTWDTYEDPVAYIRRGDDETIFTQFTENGGHVQVHDARYRSVHYIIKSRPAKVLQLIEVQVRSHFEEGWSEIDHRVRYPYRMDNPFLQQCLGVLNTLAGAADEMGTFIQGLQIWTDTADENLKAAVGRASALQIEIDQMRATVTGSELPESEKERIEGNLVSIEKLKEANLVEEVIAPRRNPRTASYDIFDSIAALSAASKFGISDQLTDALKQISEPPWFSDSLARAIKATEASSSLAKIMEANSLAAKMSELVKLSAPLSFTEQLAKAAVAAYHPSLHSPDLTKAVGAFVDDRREALAAPSPKQEIPVIQPDPATKPQGKRKRAPTKRAKQDSLPESLNVELADAEPLADADENGG